MFDVWMMVVFGMIGFFIFDKFGIPKAPFIIARILGSMAEVNLRRALQMSPNGAAIFFTRPIALLCIAISLNRSLATIFYPLWKNRKKRASAQ